MFSLLYCHIFICKIFFVNLLNRYGIVCSSIFLCFLCSADKTTVHTICAIFCTLAHKHIHMKSYIHTNTRLHAHLYVYTSKIQFIGIVISLMALVNNRNFSISRAQRPCTPTAISIPFSGKFALSSVCPLRINLARITIQ